jgi:hypothetical protein
MAFVSSNRSDDADGLLRPRRDRWQGHQKAQQNSCQLPFQTHIRPL